MEHEARERGQGKTCSPAITESQSLDLHSVSSDPQERDRLSQLTWPRETGSKREKALAASATPGTEYWLP